MVWHAIVASYCDAFIVTLKKYSNVKRTNNYLPQLNKSLDVFKCIHFYCRLVYCYYKTTAAQSKLTAFAQVSVSNARWRRQARQVRQPRR